MYHYVEDKQFLRKAKTTCSNIMKELEELLRNEYDMNTQFFLVGSGARNMVTQNEEQPIDFDYNLNIISCEDWNDAKGIKETVRKAFNRVMSENGLGDVDDSTSTLTTKPFHFRGEPDIEFSMDVCIVTKDTDNLWERLKHEKTGFSYYDRYYWNVAPNSSDYKEKSDEIKTCAGWWEVVRSKYLEIKNMYLRKNDKDHPSFVCYIEAINSVHNTMRQKGILK